MYNVQWCLKEKVTNILCLGEDLGNGYAEEGTFAFNLHAVAGELCHSSLACRMWVCGQWV